MELSQLRAFVSVSRYGTIAAAAEELHITPSPLSRTIRDLERTVGADLFVRGYHHFDLTEAGARLLPRAVELLAEADDANSVARPPRLPRIAASADTGDELTMRFGQSASRAAGAPLDPKLDTPPELLCDLRHGMLDLVLTSLSRRYPDLRCAVLEARDDAPVGLAWRSRDVVNGELVRRVVRDFAPAGLRPETAT